MPALPSAPRRRACSPRARPCTTARAGSTVLHACSVAGSECRVVIGQGIRTFGQELKAWHHLFVNRRADRTPCAAPRSSPILLWRTFLKFSPTTTKNVLFEGVATLSGAAHGTTRRSATLAQMEHVRAPTFGDALRATKTHPIMPDTLGVRVVTVLGPLVSRWPPRGVASSGTRESNHSLSAPRPPSVLGWLS